MKMAVELTQSVGPGRIACVWYRPDGCCLRASGASTAWQTVFGIGTCSCAYRATLIITLIDMVIIWVIWWRVLERSCGIN